MDHRTPGTRGLLFLTLVCVLLCVALSAASNTSARKAVFFAVVRCNDRCPHATKGPACKATFWNGDSELRFLRMIVVEEPGESAYVYNSFQFGFWVGGGPGRSSTVNVSTTRTRVSLLYISLRQGKLPSSAPSLAWTYEVSSG